MAAPKAKKVPVTRSFHGREFVDDYEWLRDKDDPEVIARQKARQEILRARAEREAIR